MGFSDYSFSHDMTFYQRNQFSETEQYTVCFLKILLNLLVKSHMTIRGEEWLTWIT